MIFKIVKKEKIAKAVFDYEIEAFEDLPQVKAGQFIYINCGGKSFLRRPISVCDVTSRGNLRFIFEVRGEGTYELSKKEQGEYLDVLGPLGNCFDIENSSDKKVLIIGGGIGIFPLLKLSKEVKNKVIGIFGFKTKDKVLLHDEFKQICEKVIIGTEDGSFGFQGNALEVLENNINDKNFKEDICAIYTCGPIKLMESVAKLGVKNNIKTQVSLEERMGCGIGACMACTCNLINEKARVCKEGPVFDAKNVIWQS